MKTTEFDEKFDNDEDISEFLDFSQATRPGREQKKVNVDFPIWMVDALDEEAKKIGVTRQINHKSLASGAFKGKTW